MSNTETFLLFSQDFPPNDLGMLDPRASHVEVEVAGRQYIIHQSTGLLNSSREAGTTGAMLWKVTPLICEWLASQTSILWSEGILSSASSIVELGCGTAGLIGLTVSPFVSSYLLTDQAYIMKLLKDNLAANAARPKSVKKLRHLPADMDNLHVLPLDWENDSVDNLLQAVPNLGSINMVLLCDCIYNSYLIQPLLQTCIDICRLKSTAPTILLIAQQLRSDQVFEEWMAALLKSFNVYRIGDCHLPRTLHLGSGYAVHLAILNLSQ